MKCPKCGYENAEDTAHCNLCGEVMNKNISDTKYSDKEGVSKEIMHYGSVLKRIVAFLIDILFISFALLFFSSWTTLEAWYAVCLIAFIYFTIMESSSLEGTIGKLALGLKVISIEKSKISVRQSVIRSLIKIVPLALVGVIFEDKIQIAYHLPSMSILRMGFISSGLFFALMGCDKYKQGFHDKIAKTYVISISDRQDDRNSNMSKWIVIPSIMIFQWVIIFINNSYTPNSSWVGALGQFFTVPLLYCLSIFEIILGLIFVRKRKILAVMLIINSIFGFPMVSPFIHIYLAR